MMDTHPRARACSMIPPLLGHTVAVTGDRRTEDLCDQLRWLGAATLIGPMVRTRPSGADRGRLWAATAAVLACPPSFFVATTAIGVRSWIDAAAAWGLDAELLAALGASRIFARGPKVVGALCAAGLPVAYAEPSARSHAMVEELVRSNLDGVTVAVQLPGAAGEPLVRELERAGANVIAIEAYDVTWPEDLIGPRRVLREVVERRVSAITFTCRDAVRHCIELARDDRILDRLVAALDTAVVPVCVGPATTHELMTQAGIASTAPTQPTLGAMTHALSGVLHRRHHRHLRPDRGQDVVVQGRLVHDGTSDVQMSDREAALLSQLVAAPRRVVGADTLLRSIWSHDEVDGAVLDTTMTRLRRRLHTTGISIETVRRRGYMLDCDVVPCPGMSGPTDAHRTLSPPVLA